ncbi:aspartate--tRNA ligase [candidate division KSB1 bacterium 4484_87]|nr:MAG: aspartate--tRNA ligase [candidate division KSB1 bacterium 4484_87]
MEKIAIKARTHTCGELRAEHDGLTVTLTGWVDSRRDHGSLIFVVLRDVYGISQVVFDPSEDKQVYESARELKNEYVIKLTGKVRRRPEGMVNPNMATGEIEVVAQDVKILNRADVPPFPIVDDVDASEELRFRYRYLDLRRPELQKNIVLRHRAAQTVRRYLDGQGFFEIETPFLMRSTPEGARDYLVPSRIHKGKFYALPQSPQTYKQILMIAGYDRYFQIVKCFRDEDLRAERQPEFTQIDMEMSFVEEEDIFRIAEGLMRTLFDEVIGMSLQTPFPIISFDEAMQRFGTDKPDVRFGMEISDVSEFVRSSEFKVFSSTVAGGGIVAGINLKGGAGYSRKQVDGLNQFVIDLGGKGVLTAKVKEDSWDSSIRKFLTDAMISGINEKLAAEAGDLLILIAGEKMQTLTNLGKLRNKLARDENLISKEEFKPLWVTEFPLLEFDEEEQRYVAMHHPFTSPREEDLALFDSSPGKVKARAYDLVLNGYEIAGGSIRNHRLDIQMKVFNLLKIDDKEAREKFGFLLDGLRFGAPPHGGIAFGFDRLLMLLAGENSIRNVIAFPKTTSALSLMDNAPAEVSEKQLKELGLKIIASL